MTSITLNESEQKLAIFLAKKRYQNARSKGKPNLKIGTQDDWQTDLEGIAGEIATCKYLNVYPDSEVDLDDLPAFDLILPDGRTADVKTTKYPNGRLLATLVKLTKPCDIYILVTGTFPTYTIRGYATAKELFKPENIGNLGHGSGYMLDQHKLHPLKNPQNG